MTWEDKSSGRLMLTRVRPALEYDTVAFPRTLGRFSNVARDGAGNYYYITYI